MTALRTARPPTPVAPTPHRWTVAEYRDLAKTGQFRDKKTMLIGGEVYVMPMPNPPHDLALGLTDDWLRTAFPTAFHVRNQMGFDVGTDNVRGRTWPSFVAHGWTSPAARRPRPC